MKHTVPSSPIFTSEDRLNPSETESRQTEYVQMYIFSRPLLCCLDNEADWMHPFFQLHLFPMKKLNCDGFKTEKR